MKDKKDEKKQKIFDVTEQESEEEEKKEEKDEEKKKNNKEENEQESEEKEKTKEKDEKMKKKKKKKDEKKKKRKMIDEIKEKKAQESEEKAKKEEKDEKSKMKKVVVKIEKTNDEVKKKGDAGSEDSVWSNPKEKEASKLMDKAIDKLLNVTTNLNDETPKPRREIKLAGSQKYPFVGSSTVKRIIKGVKVSPAHYDPFEVVDEFLHEKLLDFMKTDD